MNDVAKQRRETVPPRGGLGLGGALTRLARLFGTAPAVEDAPPLNVSHATETPVAPRPALVRDPQPLAQSLREDLLTRSLEALHIPVVVVDGKMMVVHANAEARHLFGERIVGRNFGLFFRDSQALDEIEDTLADGTQRQADINIEAPLKRQYRLRITRLSPRAGETGRAVLEFQETTLIRRTETMRSDFVANVSHELRSPLATLIGFIETLRDDGADGTEMSERFLTIMEGEAQRMRRLIDDLLSLTNVELREHERPRARVDVADVLGEVVDSLRPRAAAQGLEIHLASAAGLEPACGERDQLIQVFHNLITNAIKYGADGERVDVAAMMCPGGLPDGGSSIEVRVRDYGQGIAREHLPRLTERFYRVDKGRSRAMGGTGLGLAIVKHIVNRHRGRFLVDSQEGAGSVFSVRLPVYREDVRVLSDVDAINT